MAADHEARVFAAIVGEPDQSQFMQDAAIPINEQVRPSASVEL